MEYIAERELKAVSSNGDILKVIIGIGVPILTDTDDWLCPIKMEGLDYELRSIHGVDSWQAIQLARNLIIDLLSNFLTKGGKLFLYEREINANDLFQAF